MPPTRTGGPAPRRPDAADPVRIKLFWLVKIHWTAIVGQVLVILAVPSWLGVQLPRGALLTVVGLQALAMLLADFWGRTARHVHESAIVALMLFDASVLTAMLVLAGGSANPFSMIYVSNVALAAVMLRPAWSWALLGASLALFGVLFLASGSGAMPGMQQVSADTVMRLHMRGMWLALAVSAVFIVYIVQRVTRELAQLEEELARERSLVERQAWIASLATLAAGAAHELSTPLSTIAVVTRELQRSLLEGPRDPQDAQEDLALIKQQIGRCQDILHQMSANAGENAGEPIRPITLAEWAESALEGLPARERVVLLSEIDLRALAVEGPARGLARALRSLLKNAVQASPGDAQVELRFSAGEDGLIGAEVADHGSGMPPDILARAGEPFFTTKVPGEGMGLGLFLTRALAEQLGGAFEVESEPGKGTIARLRLPAALASETGAAA